MSILVPVRGGLGEHFQTIELGSVRCLDIHWIVSLLCYVFDQFLYYFLFIRGPVYLFISMSCMVYMHLN